MVGAWFLLQLLQHPGQDFTPEQLETASDPSFAENVANQPPLLLESGIPYCDAQTLKQVRSRIKNIQSRLDSPRCGKARTRQLSSELTQLQAYLRDCVAPGGKIRTLNSPAQKPGRSIRAALNRLLEAAHKEESCSARPHRQPSSHGQGLCLGSGMNLRISPPRPPPLRKKKIGCPRMRTN